MTPSRFVKPAGLPLEFSEPEVPNITVSSLESAQIMMFLTLWRTLHHANDTFYNIIYIRKVPTAVSVVEDLNGLTCQQLVGETEVGHVRTTGGTINGEEP